MLYVFTLSIIAFLGGILSIASPCSGLLIPLYFAHVFKTKDKFLLNAILFFIGSYFASLLITLGIYYVFLSLPFSATLYKLVGLLFILIGLGTLFGKSFSLPLKIPKLKNLNKNKYLSSLILGIFASFSHGGCCGPILGLIATNVAKLDNIFLALFIILFYTIGITLPFILIALGLDKLAILKAIFVKGKNIYVNIFNKKITFHSSNIISSLLFVISGLLLILFNGSFAHALIIFNIDLDFMLQYQDSLINLFFNR